MMMTRDTAILLRRERVSLLPRVRNYRRDGIKVDLYQASGGAARGCRSHAARLELELKRP